MWVLLLYSFLHSYTVLLLHASKCLQPEKNYCMIEKVYAILPLSGEHLVMVCCMPLSFIIESHPPVILNPDLFLLLDIKVEESSVATNKHAQTFHELEGNSG